MENFQNLGKMPNEFRKTPGARPIKLTAASDEETSETLKKADILANRLLFDSPPKKPKMADSFFVEDSDISSQMTPITDKYLGPPNNIVQSIQNRDSEPMDDLIPKRNRQFTPGFGRRLSTGNSLYDVSELQTIREHSEMSSHEFVERRPNNTILNVNAPPFYPNYLLQSKCARVTDFNVSPLSESMLVKQRELKMMMEDSFE